MKIKKLSEELLNEASEILLEDVTFGESGEVLRNHYKRHCLADGETFNPANPKFDSMTFRDYLSRCNDLVQKKCSTDFSSDVFGWLQWRPVDRDYTIVKFEKLPDGMYQCVAYEAFGRDVRNAFTYMLYRGGLPRIERVYNSLKEDGYWVSDMNDQAYFTTEELEVFDQKDKQSV